MIYALLGIPLFGFLLAGVGDQLGTIFGKSISKVEKMIEVSVLSVRLCFLSFFYGHIVFNTFVLQCNLRQNSI